MSDIQELMASTRDRAGKGAARAARRQGLVPAVIYGDKKDPEMVTVERRVIAKHYLTGNFLSTVYDLVIEGKKNRVIPKAIDLDKVRDFPIHVDFLRLAKGASVTVEVSMNFTNEDDSPGLSRGGVLNVVRYTVEVDCPADAIPEFLEGDLTGLEIGDSIHISAVKLPEGVVPTISDRDFTIATIASPTVETEPADVDTETDGDAVETEDKDEADGDDN